MGRFPFFICLVIVNLACGETKIESSNASSEVIQQTETLPNEDRPLPEERKPFQVFENERFVFLYRAGSARVFYTEKQIEFKPNFVLVNANLGFLPEGKSLQERCQLQRNTDEVLLERLRRSNSKLTLKDINPFFQLEGPGLYFESREIIFNENELNEVSKVVGVATSDLGFEKLELNVEVKLPRLSYVQEIERHYLENFENVSKEKFQGLVSGLPQILLIGELCDYLSAELVITTRINLRGFGVGDLAVPKIQVSISNSDEIIIP